MDHSIEAIISGKVQGVMFRDFATRKARRLKLAGEVQNLPDGTVRVVAEGEKEQIEKFIAELKKGSLLSHVSDVRIEWKAASNTYSEFTISYAQ